eukprot:scaffold580181_cov15-Prasinocladus_malaysianus.AAC.1
MARLCLLAMLVLSKDRPMDFSALRHSHRCGMCLAVLRKDLRRVLAALLMGHDSSTREDIPRYKASALRLKAGQTPLQLTLSINHKAMTTSEHIGC